jgi:hypothetical protein
VTAAHAESAAAHGGAARTWEKCDLQIEETAQPRSFLTASTIAVIVGATPPLHPTLPTAVDTSNVEPPRRCTFEVDQCVGVQLTV